MADAKPKKGRFVRDYSAICGACGEESSLGTRTRPSETALGLGWCHVHDLGWVCPKHIVTPGPTTKVEDLPLARSEPPKRVPGPPDPPRPERPREWA